MTTLFCVRPATRNIGNDIIHVATARLLSAAFGPDLNIVNIPALAGPQNGGFTARQVYDMNRVADGVVIGGGNLFENGQLTIDDQALAALRRPLMVIGLSHGRIYDRDGSWMDRSDAMPAAKIRRLVDASVTTLVRDRATAEILGSMDISNITVGGCPTLFLPETPSAQARTDRVLLSVREPGRMSVPPPLQWRVAEDVRALIALLHARYGRVVQLVCHDYADLQFAAGFPEAPALYFDDVERYMEALRTCRVSVSYRLHAFLPCLAFGTPSIHLSYDERGRAMLDTIGMAEWDINLATSPDVAAAVAARLDTLGAFNTLRRRSLDRIAAYELATVDALRRFASVVSHPEAGSTP